MDSLAMGIALIVCFLLVPILSDIIASFNNKNKDNE